VSGRRPVDASDPAVAARDRGGSDGQGHDRWVAVAEIARPHGIRGELAVRMFNEGSSLLLDKPPIRLAMKDGTERATSITHAREVAKGLLVELVGVADRTTAEGLREAKVLVRRDAFEPLAVGEFYACDVEGARVVLRGAEADLGRVKTIIEYPTCDVLVVERAEGGVLEVPLVEPYVASVDVEGGVIELATIDGLT
jgi:16S rRNA processing protein RimM